MGPLVDPISNSAKGGEVAYHSFNEFFWLSLKGCIAPGNMTGRQMGEDEMIRYQLGGIEKRKSVKIQKKKCGSIIRAPGGAQSDRRRRSGLRGSERDGTAHGRKTRGAKSHK